MGEGCSIQRQSAKSQRDEEVGRILAPVKHGQKIRQTKNRNVMPSPQLETKGQQNKRIAVSPQLKTKGQQNKRIEQQNGKQSPQLRAMVIQRKQQNVKQSPQLEFVQSETKSHQIMEMRKQADMQYRQSGNLQNEHQPDNSKHQPQLVDSSCQDSSVATSQVMQYLQHESVKNEHRPDNNKNHPQLVDSSCQDNFVSSSQVMQYPQSEDVLKEHQTDNNKNQPQLVDSSCLDDFVATSEAMQCTQSEKVQNQHQLDNNKYQPQLVGTLCLDSSVATSEANYPQSDNIQNQHCSGQSYRHLDIRTSQPQQVDTSHQESSTSREDLDSTSNQQDAKQTTQGLVESNQDRTNKPYLQLDIRTYQPQQVDTSHQESSDDQTSREEIDRTINREDPQWMLVPNQQQHSKPYPQLDIRTYQPQQVNSSCKESSDDPTSGKGVVSSVSKDVMQYLQLETVLYQQQLDTPYPQLDVETYQPQRVDTSRQESFDDLTSGKKQVSAYNKNVN